MPEFAAEVDIDPSEFIDSCNSREIKELIEALVEDGHISPDRMELNSNTGVRNPNHYDETFWESLDHLAKCRHMLTIEEETYINELAKKFKHQR